MKKFVWILLGLITIFGLLFVFTGCGAVKNAVSNLQEDAELTAKALGDSGYENSSNPTNPKVISGNWNGDISGSQYASQLTNPTTFYLTFTDHQITVKDDNGNDVTVTLNGTVNFGWTFNSDGSYEFNMIIYSDGINVKVGDEDMGSVSVDLIFSFSSSSISGTATASIEGTIGDYDINISTNINYDFSIFM